jgi:hypothetical protein
MLLKLDPWKHEVFLAVIAYLWLKAGVPLIEAIFGHSFLITLSQFLPSLYLLLQIVYDSKASVSSHITTVCRNPKSRLLRIIGLKTLNIYFPVKCDIIVCNMI